MNTKRYVVAISGGKASAWCAYWTLKKFPNDDVVLYFNDTKWEHEDLYRFLNDLSHYLKKEITFDSDGRSPEDLFYDNRAIANNMMPFCSRILKAERLQRFYQDGDTLIFGIGADEPQRALRLSNVYQSVAKKTNKSVSLMFPLISENMTSKKVDDWLLSTGIEEPLLYRLGFKHNNCSGGCVRAGKKHWKMLYEKLPNVYLERERVETEVQEFLGKDVTIFKDESLKKFRERIESGNLSSFYYEEEKEVECIGICSTIA